MVSLSLANTVVSLSNDSHSLRDVAIDAQSNPFQEKFAGLSISSRDFLTDSVSGCDRYQREDSQESFQDIASLPETMTISDGSKTCSECCSESGGESSNAASDTMFVDIAQIETKAKDFVNIISYKSANLHQLEGKLSFYESVRRGLLPFYRPLNQALRVGLCTGAGRTASWLIRQSLPPHMGALTTPLTVATSLVRSAGAYALVHHASRSIHRKSVRRAARAGGLMCGALMLAPSLCATRNPSATIANGLLHDNLADLGYVLVRDPVQNALRNFGPRVSLSATKSSGAPKLLAFVPLSMVYSVSAMLWLLAFESKINPASVALGPLAYGAIKTVGPAAVIEATEAAASTIIFSAFRDAIRSHNFAIEMPQPPVFLTTAAMRLFATGLLQLGNVIAHVVFGRPDGMPIIVFGMVMLFLEWLGAVAQQAVANILMNESQESTVTNTDKKDQQEAWSNSIKLANR